MAKNSIILFKLLYFLLFTEYQCMYILSGLVIVKITNQLIICGTKVFPAWPKMQYYILNKRENN